MDVYVNFSNFQNAFLVLFRQSTGESWPQIMFDTTRTVENNCVPNQSCGSGSISNFLISVFYVLFFIVFITLQQYIMLNLYILVLM